MRSRVEMDTVDSRLAFPKGPPLTRFTHTMRRNRHTCGNVLQACLVCVLQASQPVYHELVFIARPQARNWGKKKRRAAMMAPPAPPRHPVLLLAATAGLLAFLLFTLGQILSVCQKDSFLTLSSTAHPSTTHRLHNPACPSLPLSSQWRHHHHQQQQPHRSPPRTTSTGTTPTTRTRTPMPMPPLAPVPSP